MHYRNKYYDSAKLTILLSNAQEFYRNNDNSRKKLTACKYRGGQETSHPGKSMIKSISNSARRLIRMAVCISREVSGRSWLPIKGL